MINVNYGHRTEECDLVDFVSIEYTDENKQKVWYRNACIVKNKGEGRKSLEEWANSFIQRKGLS